jgi:hypothetical protein
MHLVSSRAKATDNLHSVHLHLPEFLLTSPLSNNRMLNGAISEIEIKPRFKPEPEFAGFCAMYDGLPFIHEQLLHPSGSHLNLS